MHQEPLFEEPVSGLVIAQHFDEDGYCVLVIRWGRRCDPTWREETYRNLTAAEAFDVIDATYHTLLGAPCS